MCRQKMSILLNEIGINEEILPKYTHTHTHIYIYIYIYTRTHTYIYTHTHTHTHIHTQDTPKLKQESLHTILIKICTSGSDPLFHHNIYRENLQVTSKQTN